MAWVLESSRSEGSDRLVLLAIANHADATGGLSWPSVELIGKEARVSRATVFRSLDSLRALGELEFVSGGGRGKTNRYQLVTWKRCQDETLSTETVSSTQLNGLTREIQNRPESKNLARAREVNFWQPEVNTPPTSSEERARILADLRQRKDT